MLTSHNGQNQSGSHLGRERRILRVVEENEYGTVPCSKTKAEMAKEIAEKLRANYVSYCTRRALTLRGEVADLWARVCASSLEEWLYDDADDTGGPASARLVLDVTGAVARLLRKHYKHPQPDGKLRRDVATLLARALSEAHFNDGGGWTVTVETCEERVCLFSVGYRFT
jgi:hypothetical protein